ncbi:peptide ABC transporter substrate-binding protein [Bradyrhizobium sp. U531]|uniref:peptide ABC transporter substrate-binding protein n=1 Tax=Bradyrhizobium sp. U531 TaxID=3053458 RepID=UPI003F444289
MSSLKSFVVAGTTTILAATPTCAGQGADGTVNILFSQAPSIMNPYLAASDKELNAASLVIEPLGGYNEDGKLFPRLAADIPTIENGGISTDLKSITWKLKAGLKWSDGTPVTARDVVFTAEYCLDPKGGCAQLKQFQGVDKVNALDDLTVQITFKSPMPVPYGPFVGARSPVIQATQFAECLGAKAPTCTDANFRPIGTGPFVVADFKPNDTILLKANRNYRDPEKPAFAEVNFKGGGDPLAAARAVLQTGEYDFAWGANVAPDVLKKMEDSGKGRTIVRFGTSVENLYLNLTDPSPSLPADERSNTKHPNPILSDLRVRKALSMAIDRTTLAKIGYGFMGKPTCDWIPAPATFAAGNKDCLQQDTDGAKKLLDQAGWKDSPDGIREKEGKKLKLSFVTSTSAVRQQFQAIMKQWWREIGIDVELKNVNPSVFFSSDPGNPDTYLKFYADIEMYTDVFNGTDPGTYVVQYVCSGQTTNIPRYCNKDYDALVTELGRTAGSERRGDIVKQLNNMVTVDSYVLVPLVWRGFMTPISNSLGGYSLNVWDTQLWNVQDWYRKK